MKNKIIVVISIILILLIIGSLSMINYFTNAEIDESLNNQTDSFGRSVTNIEMKIKDGTLTNTSATLIITDHNAIPYGYGLDYRIDVKKNGKWKKVWPINWDYAISELAYVAEQNKPFEMRVDWSELYGELKPGEYRIVKHQQETNSLTKKVQYYYFWVEFVID